MLQKIVSLAGMFSDLTCKIGEGICTGLGFLIPTLIILAVFFRYVLGDALSWPEEIVQFIVIWVAFVGASVATKSGSLFSFRILADLLQGVPRLVSTILINLCGIAFVMIFLYYGVGGLAMYLKFKATVTGVSYFWPALGMYVGSGMMLVHLVHGLLGAVYEATQSRAESNKTAT
jgi:TRAP-type C4-dicarboxylate transport system permease small subunit